MKKQFPKIVAVTLLAAIPCILFYINNFVYYTRGWHEMFIQYHTFFWVARFISAPVLALVVLQLWKRSNTASQLTFYALAGFTLYTILCGAISFAACRFLASSYDGRTKNLLDTIQNESIFLNGMLYAISVAIVFTWCFLGERKATEASSRATIKSLAEAEAALQQIKEDALLLQQQTAFRLSVKSGYKTLLIPGDAISYIRSNGPYVTIQTEKGPSYLLKKTLTEIEKILPASFIRVHRSSIINTSFIKECISLLNGDAVFLLTNGSEVRASRTYRERIKEILNTT